MAGPLLFHVMTSHLATMMQQARQWSQEDCVNKALLRSGTWISPYASINIIQRLNLYSTLWVGGGAPV